MPLISDSQVPCVMLTTVITDCYSVFNKLVVRVWTACGDPSCTCIPGGRGVFQISSDGDDRIGAKIQTQKNP